MRLSCVILAAGNSVRFGENKLMYPVRQRPLCSYAVALHQGIDYCCRILVTQSGYTGVRQIADAAGFTVVINKDPARGIGSSVACAMAQIDLSHIDGILFAVADQPYLTAQTCKRLIAAFSETPNCIIAPIADGKRGNPVIFPKSCFAALSLLTGDIGGSYVIRAHEGLLRLVEIDRAMELQDMDTKQEEHLC